MTTSLLPFLFKKEEFVGYLRGDGRYILAQVVEEIDSKSDCLLFNFGRKYKINLGRNIPVLVGTPDLFKFVRPIVPKAKRNRHQPDAANGGGHFILEPVDADKNGNATYQASLFIHRNRNYT